MDNENVQAYLKEKYPGAFDGWDGYEFAFLVRNRKDETPNPVMLAILYNKGEGGYRTDIHSCFLITMGEDGEENIRVGKGELYLEYNHAYVPEFAK